METTTTSVKNDAPAGSNKGRWMVLVIFAFAFAATGLIYLYWDLHTAPFRPFQEAIDREYKGSQPLVRGGQEKMHENSPRQLMVTLRVDFDPTSASETGRLRTMVDRITNMADEYLGLANYDTFELYFVQRRPQKQSRVYEKIRRTEDILSQTP